MKRLIILIFISLVSVSCVGTSIKGTKGKYSEYQIVDNNNKWITYKVDDAHFLCIPNHSADIGAVPLVLKIDGK